MVNIVIKDLEMSKELDKKAMTELIGGKGIGKRFKSAAAKLKQPNWLAKNYKKNFL